MAFISSRSVLGLVKQVSGATRLAGQRTVVIASKRNISDTSNRQQLQAAKIVECAPQKEIRNFTDAIEFTNEVKEVMLDTNPFFPLMKDNSYSPETRLSFTPFMMGFAMGFADFSENILKVHKPANELNDVEKQVNAYCDEDDFHYNFYLMDLASLGSKLEDFGTVEGLLRHEWGLEGVASRRVIYSLVEAVASHTDPRLRMLSAELVEAGLYGFFTTIYSHIVKQDNNLPTLHYYGDSHVGLEVGHKVTAQFSGKDHSEEEENQWMREDMDPDVAVACQKSVVHVMDCFDKMFRSYHDIVLQVNDGKLKIRPERYIVEGTPPMAKILG